MNDTAGQKMALDITPIEHRDQVDLQSHRLLYDYWDRLRAGMACPGYDQIDVLGIDRSLLPWLMLAEVDRERDDYLYRVVGTGIDDHNGFFATGQYLSDVPLANKADMRASFDRVVATRQPHFSASRYIGVHRNFKLARRLLLPLSRTRAEQDVTFIVCAVDFIQV